MEHVNIINIRAPLLTEGYHSSVWTLTSSSLWYTLTDVGVDDPSDYIMLQIPFRSHLPPPCVSSVVVSSHSSLSICTNSHADFYVCVCVCSEQIWASSPDRTEQKIAATTAGYAHMHSVTDRSKDHICFNMYCTFTGRMSELLDLQHLECFQKCHMLISSPFFFCSETLRGDCSWCWQHLNANAKCRKCQIMLWLIERAWLWTVWLWLHE